MKEEGDENANECLRNFGIRVWCAEEGRKLRGFVRCVSLRNLNTPFWALGRTILLQTTEHDWEHDGWGTSPLTPFPHSFKLFKLHFPPKRLQTRSLLIPRFCTSRVSTLSPTPNSLAGTLMTSLASTPPKSMDVGLWFPSSSHFPALVPISPFQFEIQALDFPVSPLLIFPFPHIPISRIRNPTNRPAPHLIASEELKGKIDYRHAYVDFSKLEVTVPKQGGDNEVVKTCPAAMGFGFAAGTTDGPGAFDFKQGDAKVDGMNIVWQSPKPILLATGEMNIPYDWAYAENLSTEPAEVASSSSAASNRSDPSSSMRRSGFRKWS
ncbi:hypothetical protein Droror1_Dr00013576 [Drosera rotundifolia]